MPAFNHYKAIVADDFIGNECVKNMPTAYINFDQFSEASYKSINRFYKNIIGIISLDNTMKRKSLCLIILTAFSMISAVGAQENEGSKSRTMFALDSRNTLVDENAVGIYGIRLGYQFAGRWEAGVGFYSSRLFQTLGKEVEKPYNDEIFGDIETRVGFGYGSIFGEYELVENNRWRITANTQFGIGEVVLRFDERERKKEGKTLMEHSFKAKYSVFSWLDLTGGIGYRYLLSGAPQIKDAFNAPIYIISVGVDFRQLLGLKKTENA